MATSIGHTFSSACILHHASNEFTRRASVASPDPPPISIQYFYSSTRPIDDPLSPVPPPSSNPANKALNVPPRPFSVHDNIALEYAWLKLQRRVPSKNNAPGAKIDSNKLTPKSQEHLLQVIRDGQEKQLQEEGQTNSQGFKAMEPMPESRSDMINQALGNLTHPAGFGKEHRRPSLDLTLGDDPEYIPFDSTMPVSPEDIGNDEFESGIVAKKRSWSPFRRKENVEQPKAVDEPLQPEPASPSMQNAGDVNLVSSLS